MSGAAGVAGNGAIATAASAGDAEATFADVEALSHTRMVIQERCDGSRPCSASSASRSKTTRSADTAFPPAASSPADSFAAGLC